MMFAVAETARAAAQALEPTEIFDRARGVVGARTAPPFIAYTQTATFVRHGKSRSRTERIILRTADGTANVTPVDSAHAQSRVDDRPMIFPTSTFGFAGRPPGEHPSTFEAGANAAPAAGPAVIGRVSATSRAYDVTLADTEILDGVPVYHLVLAPRFDPRHNRIRAMYVDTHSFDPRRIVIEYYAERGPLRSRPTVTFDYAQTDGKWLIARGALDFVVRFGLFAYGGSGDLQLSDVSFPATEPDWLFDRAALAQHQ